MFRILIVGLLVSVFFVETGHAQVCGAVHTVRPGESLSGIARLTHGKASAYRQIYRANINAIGRDPSLLRSGTKIFIPCGDQQGLSVGQEWDLMPSVDTLEALMKFGTQVVDLRLSDSVKGGIIPGAMSIPYPFWRGPKENPGAPPSDRALSRTIGGAGLKLDRPIVLVSGTAAPFDTGRAAYVYWILKSLGAKQLAILKGGHAAWKASGRPLASTPYRGRQYRVQLKLSDQWRAGQSDVEQIAAGTLKGTLLDARPSQMFAKQTLTQQSVPSTLPGAYNSPAPSAHRLATAEGSYREGAMSVLDGLKTQKVNWSHDTVVSFCNTGELGALNWFYASEVSGIKNVKLYPESATGWKHAGHKLAVPSIDR